MAHIEGFNPEEFAKNLTAQAKQVIPADLSNEDKEFISKILFRFCMLAGDALVKDETVNINVQQACIITQFIGEWTFHKSVDLIRSGIPMDKRDPILQKVAFAVFEESRDVIVNNIEQNQAIARVEQAVGIAYEEAINELKKQNQLDDGLAEKARQESNIDKMAQQNESQESNQPGPAAKNQSAQQGQAPGASPRLMKLAAIAMLLKNMPEKNAQRIVGRFNERDFKAIMSYMHLEGLEEAFDMNLIRDFMHDFLMSIPEEAQAYRDHLARQKYTELTKSVSEQKLNDILGSERNKIKNTIQDPGKLKEIPSKVSGIVYNYLNEKVNQ